MSSRSDQELLRGYAEEGSESAFSEVMRRHADLVYSVALRLVRDQQLAEDVSQRVFLALASNAVRLADRQVLAGWLHRTAHNLSANAVRADVRHRACEREAAAMNDLLVPEADPNWQSIGPHLDSALSQLNEPDRDALLLRYFQGKSANEMAGLLGISGQAAQKRVNRAVERLRELFAKQGIAIGASGLVALISANAVQSAPASLSAALASTSFVKSSAHVSTVLSTAKILVMTTLQKTAVAAVVAVIIGIGIYRTREAARSREQKQKQALAEHASEASKPGESPQPAPDAIAKTAPERPLRAKLPAPMRKVVPSKKAITGVPFPSTRLYAFLAKKEANLTQAQVASYLAANGRNAASLLAAYRTTRDPALLTEAAQKYPTDPQVAFETSMQGGASPQDRRSWLDALKQSAPDNALPNYLSALDYFKSGQTAEAIQDLNAADGKIQFQDYSQARTQGDEAAYVAAGYPSGEAKMMANAFLTEAELPQFKELAQNLIGLAAGYQQSGDQTSHDTALQIAVYLGRRLGDPSGSESMLHQLVGVSIETAALSGLDPAVAYDTAGQTVQNRLDQLAEQKATLHTLTAQADPLWQTLSDQDWIGYHAQLAASGEETALRWLVSNYASH
ncbi:MAG TPA: RNA polymerase sigma factor [Verrucomicrobiae bacterium]|nr:RNA polymerase sigma factor [Verrucomicrobiae bacterium]